MIDVVRAIRMASQMKTSRNLDGFFADRLVQALNEPTLLAFVEKLVKVMDASVELIGGARTAALVRVASSSDAQRILAWMRRHPRVLALLALMKSEADLTAATLSIELEDVASDDSTADPQGGYGINIAARLLAPLAHGGDTKAGNATLFRRRHVITRTGKVLDLPFYSGNAVRGQLRDILADHLLAALGLSTDRSKPALNLWFFHALYAGGVLEERGGKARLDAALGNHGAIRTDGIRELRAMLPGLSLLGAAMGNRILPGRLYVGDLRPRCLEWGNGDVPVHNLMEHVFLTRRDDYEGRQDGEEHAGMIATTETIKEGVELVGGIDVDTHASELERSALGVALATLVARGMLGAENRRGLGRVVITTDNTPDTAQYEQFLADNRNEILAYLAGLGALDEQRQADLFSNP
jgi:hypothetical protein